MRIGIFSDAYLPNISGVVTSITMLTDGLKKMGHEVFVFTLNTDKTKTPVIVTDKVYRFKGYRPPFGILDQYRINISLKNKLKYVKECNLDVIHIHTEFSVGKFGLYCSKKLKIPMIYTFHTLYEDYLRYISVLIDKKFHRAFLWTTSHVLIKPISKRSMFDIVPTKKVLQYTSRYNMNGEIRVIPTGIDLEHFNCNEITSDQISYYRNLYGISEDDFVFLYLGRISEEKSIDVIVEAFSKSLLGVKNAKLIIVGDGPYLITLKNLVKKLNIENQVIFTGFILWKDIPILYNLANIFVNASITETQGLTYIEALASSCPILVQIDSCLEDVVVDYYNGIFFDGTADLASKMGEIVAHPAVLKRIKTNTAKSVEKFSKICYANNILKTYEDAIIKFNSSKQ